MTSDPARMSPHEAAPVAPRRATTLTLTVGTVLGALCFGIAVVADLAGPHRRAPVGDVGPAELLSTLLSLSPWAWAVVGCLTVIATPVVGLVVTAFEFDSVADRRGGLFAVGVLAVLGIGLLVALLA